MAKAGKMKPFPVQRGVKIYSSILIGNGACGHGKFFSAPLGALVARMAGATEDQWLPKVVYDDSLTSLVKFGELGAGIGDAHLLRAEVSFHRGCKDDIERVKRQGSLSFHVAGKRERQAAIEQFPGDVSILVARHDAIDAQLSFKEPIQLDGPVILQLGFTADVVPGV